MIATMRTSEFDEGNPSNSWALNLMPDCNRITSFYEVMHEAKTLKKSSSSKILVLLLVNLSACSKTSARKSWFSFCKTNKDGHKLK